MNFYEYEKEIYEIYRWIGWLCSYHGYENCRIGGLNQSISLIVIELVVLNEL